MPLDLAATSLGRRERDRNYELASDRARRRGSRSAVARRHLSAGASFANFRNRERGECRQLVESIDRRSSVEFRVVASPTMRARRRRSFVFTAIYNDRSRDRNYRVRLIAPMRKCCSRVIARRKRAIEATAVSDMKRCAHDAGEKKRFRAARCPARVRVTRESTIFCRIVASREILPTRSASTCTCRERRGVFSSNFYARSSAYIGSAELSVFSRTVDVSLSNMHRAREILRECMTDSASVLCPLVRILNWRSTGTTKQRQGDSVDEPNGE